MEFSGRCKLDEEVHVRSLPSNPTNIDCHHSMVPKQSQKHGASAGLTHPVSSMQPPSSAQPCARNDCMRTHGTLRTQGTQGTQRDTVD